MQKQKNSEPAYFVRGRKTGDKKFEVLGNRTNSFSEAASKMWEAFNDDAVYDKTEIVMLKDGDESRKFTAIKKFSG